MKCECARRRLFRNKRFTLPLGEFYTCCRIFQANVIPGVQSDQGVVNIRGVQGNEQRGGPLDTC